MVVGWWEWGHWEWWGGLEYGIMDIAHLYKRIKLNCLDDGENLRFIARF